MEAASSSTFGETFPVGRQRDDVHGGVERRRVPVVARGVDARIAQQVVEDAGRDGVRVVRRTHQQKVRRRKPRAQYPPRFRELDDPLVPRQPPQESHHRCVEGDAQARPGGRPRRLVPAWVEAGFGIDPVAASRRENADLVRITEAIGDRRPLEASTHGKDAVREPACDAVGGTQDARAATAVEARLAPQVIHPHRDAGHRAGEHPGESALGRMRVHDRGPQAAQEQGQLEDGRQVS